MFYQKYLFFPSQLKKYEEISPYFSLSEMENFPKLHLLFEKKLPRLAFFGKIGKIEKNCSLYGRVSKFALFGVKIAPPSL